MKLRFDDEELEIGDVAVHGEEAYPQEEVLSTRLSRDGRGRGLTDDGGAAPAGEGQHRIGDLRYVAAVTHWGPRIGVPSRCPGARPWHVPDGPLVS